MQNLHPLILFAKTHKAAITKWSQIKESNFDDTFNVFNLFSDTYYRENFHSYFLAAILDPNGAHGEGSKYLELFIDLINSISDLKVRWKDFENTVVNREVGRIDISILDTKAKRAIIIENKINNASDMGRQLPRYYNDLIAQRYKSIEAIVYLPLDVNKEPSQHDWESGDADKINPRLVILPAYKVGGKDLTNGFIGKAIAQANSLTVKYTLIQYQQLLKQLAQNYLELNQLEIMINEISPDENYQQLVKSAQALLDLPKQYAQRLHDTFGPIRPKGDCWVYKSTTSVIDNIHHGGFHFAIDIVCFPEKYVVEFFERKLNLEQVEKLFPKLILTHGFQEIQGRYKREYLIENPKATEAIVVKDVKALLTDIEAFRKAK
jgi:hypothetical protein